MLPPPPLQATQGIVEHLEPTLTLSVCKARLN